MPPAIPDAPWWVTALLVAAAIFLAPLLTSRADRRRTDLNAAEKLRDDMLQQLEAARKHLANSEATLNAMRQENQRLLTAVVQITTSFNEFQLLMLREAIGVSILLDTKDVEGASARLESLIRHVKELKVIPTEAN